MLRLCWAKETIREGLKRIGIYGRPPRPVPCLDQCSPSHSNDHSTLNQHRLPFLVDHRRTCFACQQAGMVAAMLDAAARTTSPSDTHGMWVASKFHRSRYGPDLVRVRLSRTRCHPLVGWPDCAELSYVFFDDQAYVIKKLDIKMHQSWHRLFPSLQMIQYGRRSEGCVGLLLDLMLTEGIAPDRGDDAVLRAFYGVNGLVSLQDAQHLGAAAAALKRNPGLREFFSPELTAALL